MPLSGASQGMQIHGSSLALENGEVDAYTPISISTFIRNSHLPMEAAYDYTYWLDPYRALVGPNGSTWHLSLEDSDNFHVRSWRCPLEVDASLLHIIRYDRQALQTHENMLQPQ